MLNNDQSCLVLGLIFKKGQTNIEPDDNKSAKYFKKSCDLGNSSACAAYAIYNINGKSGFLVDFENSESLLKKSCDELDNVHGCYILGTFYKHDKPNRVLSVRYYNKACAKEKRYCKIFENE
jgi:TPR repeat protein